MNGVTRLFFHILASVNFCSRLSDASFSDRIQNVRVASGDSAALSCPLEFPGGVVQPYIVHWLKQGIPDPIYRWHEGERPVVAPEYDGRVTFTSSPSLSINAVTPFDLGWYECRIFIQQSGIHDMLRNDTWILLEISDDVYFLEEPKDAIIISGTEVKLHCKFSLPVQLQWTLNNELIDMNDHKQLKVKDDYLLIHPIKNHSSTSSIDGVYHCVAIIGNVALSSRPAKVQVAVLQPFEEREDVLEEAIEGGVAIIQCHPPLSRPKGKLHIEKDGLPIDISDRMYRLQGNGFKIMAVNKDDEGAYRCSLENQMLNLSVTAPWVVKVVITVPKQSFAAEMIISPKKSSVVTLKSNLTLECAAKGFPNPVIQWSKYGDQMPISRYNTSMGNLHLFNIQKGDEGTYVCRAENGVDPVVSAYSIVEIQGSLAFSQSLQSQNQTVKEGSSVVFLCNNDDMTKPLIKWMHNGFELNLSEKIIFKDKRLLLKEVTLSSAGFYQCFISNELGIIYSTAYLRVIPNLVSLSANARRDPSGSDNSSIINGRPDDNFGEITEDTWDTTSKYDKQNTRKHKTSNSGKDKMVPPSRPKITKLSDESVMVRWNVPENDGLLISFFKVQYKDISKSNSRWMTIDDEIAPHIHSFEVSNLKLGHIYRFRIAAVYSNNDNKLGPNSSKFHLQKDPPMKKPIVGPAIIHAEAVSPSAILIKWEYMDIEMVPIEGFFIYYRETTSAGAYTKVPVIGANTQSHIISHLLPKVTYEIKMQCFNTAGTSDFSNILTQSTLDDLSTGHDNDIHISTSVPVLQSNNELLYMVLCIVLGTVLLTVMLLFCAYKYCQHQQSTEKRCKYEESLQPSDLELEGLTETKFINGNLTPANGHALSNGYSSSKPVHISVNPVNQFHSESTNEAIKSNLFENAEDYCENSSWDDGSNITSQTAIDPSLEEHSVIQTETTNEFPSFSSFRKPPNTEGDSSVGTALLQDTTANS